MYLSKLRQNYRYHRNWRKYKERPKNHKEHLCGELQIYSQFIKEGDLCFNIGANIGDKTEVFLLLGTVVVAVEPQESRWRVLKHRFKDKSVKIVSMALDKSTGNKEFYLDRSRTISSMSPQWIDSVKKSGRFSTHKWNDKIIVETSTLDMLIAKYGKPAFCKIGVEGAEYEVLQGLYHPIEVISFEFIPEYLEPVPSCIAYLSKLSNAEFNFTLGNSTDFGMPGWSNVDDIVNILHILPSDVRGDIYASFIKANVAPVDNELTRFTRRCEDDREKS